MRVVRLLHANRMVLCLGLVGMLAMASGCGQDYTAEKEATPEQKAKMEQMRETMKGARSKEIGESKKSTGRR